MNRRLRRLATAFLAGIALLLSQLVVSAHACEQLAGVAAMPAMEANGCPAMDTVNLCDQHCQFGHSAVDQGKPAASPDVTSGPALHVQQPYPSRLLAGQAPREAPLPPEPPPAIRFSVLRI